jgi:hypothetical protein
LIIFGLGRFKHRAKRSKRFRSLFSPPAAGHAAPLARAASRSEISR